jgi:hypothetical protein
MDIRYKLVTAELCNEVARIARGVDSEKQIIIALLQQATMGNKHFTIEVPLYLEFSEVIKSLGFETYPFQERNLIVVTW